MIKLTCKNLEYMQKRKEFVVLLDYSAEIVILKTAY